MYIIVVFTLILILLYFLYSRYLKKTHESFNGKNIEIVVSRFNEDLEWTNTNLFSKYPIICYNKGVNNNYKVNNLKKKVKLPNIGRESHTYLYHIINNYDNLADVTVFLPGSVKTDVYNKWTRANILMENLETHQNTIFIGAIHNNVRDELYNFKMDNYDSTNSSNKNINPETKLEISVLRPYGLWYDNHFNDIKIQCISYSGIFAVSKEHILQKPKSYYKNLIKELSNTSNPEVGHYFERSWVAIFNPTENALFVNTNHLF